MPQDYNTAAKLYGEAAQKGLVPAQLNLGHMYEDGVAVPQDYAKASEWYSKAADQGDTAAQNNLGVIYAEGKGVPRDDVTAAKWFILAKAGGDKDATGSLPRLESQMTHDQTVSAEKAAQKWQAGHHQR